MVFLLYLLISKNIFILSITSHSKLKMTRNNFCPPQAHPLVLEVHLFEPLEKTFQIKCTLLKNGTPPTPPFNHICKMSAPMYGHHFPFTLHSKRSDIERMARKDSAMNGLLSENNCRVLGKRKLS